MMNHKAREKKPTEILRPLRVFFISYITANDFITQHIRLFNQFTVIFINA